MQVLKENAKKRYIIMLIIILSTLGGCYLYSHKKQQQFGGDFKFHKFLFSR
jgi:hypothetical protein